MMDVDPCPVVAITDLPLEVISLIIDFLPLEDTISASLTCKKWYYEVSQFWNKLADRIVLVTKMRVIQDLCPTEDKHRPGTFLGEGPQITDSTLKLIGTYCLQLKFLFLSECPITDVGIGYLSNLRRLRTISLGNCSLLTDASLETLMMAKLPLRKAYYEDTKFSANAKQKFEEWLER